MVGGDGGDGQLYSAMNGAELAIEKRIPMNQLKMMMMMMMNFSSSKASKHLQNH